MDKDPVLEELMSHIGDWGKYQCRQFTLHMLGGFLAGLHMLTLTTIAATPPHRCYIEQLDGNGTLENPFDVELLRPYIPVKDGVIDSCSMYTVPYGENETVKCNGFVYDKTYYKESRVYEWDMVCDARWERAVLQSIYMFGVLIGAIVLGTLGDRFGRKVIFCLSGVLQLIAGISSAFITNLNVYVVVLFFYGMFGSAGAYVTGFVLTMELIGKSKRTLCGTIFSAAFGMGIVAVAFWAFFVTNVTWLQIVYSLHSLLIVFHWWLIDESVRWLWGQHRMDEAIAIVEGAAKVNGLPFDKSNYDIKLCESVADKVKKSSGMVTLLKSPRLRPRALNVAFAWLANALVYFGLSLNAGNLVGNPFLMLLLMGLVEIPGYFIVVWFVDKTGRRSLCVSLMLLGGAACIISAFIPPGDVTTTLSLLGKMAIAASFAIVYNYTAEIFPTVVRNSAVGLGSMAARLGGLLTPLLGLLDSLDKELPVIIFGTVSVLSALMALFLPETLNKDMPQTLEDGENFGRGDTGYKTAAKALKRIRSNTKNAEITNGDIEVTERLNDTT